MNMLRTAALMGFLGVAIGAFGAHGLADHLESTGRRETFETGVLYHLVHAAVLLALGVLCQVRPHSDSQNLRVAGWCFASGIVLFSGSLYLLGITDAGVFGAITPLGGVLFLIGWAALAWR